MNSPASGWQRDPTARHEYRYWDGSRWTDDVADRGVTSTDPMPAGPGADPTQVIDPTQSFPSAPGAPSAPTQAYGQPPATGYQPDGAPGFGPYGTLPDQPGSYGSPGSGGVPPAAGPPPNTGAKTSLFVGIGVLVVAAVVGVAFLLTKDDGDSDETSTNPLSDQTIPGDSGGTTLPSDPGDDSGDDTSDGSGDTGGIDSFDDLEGLDPDDVSEEDLIPLVADELASSGVMSEDQATCMAEAMFDVFSLDEIIAIGESGASDPMSALTPDQMNALTSAAVDCLGGAVEP